MQKAAGCGDGNSRIYVVYTETTWVDGQIVDQWSTVLHSYCTGDDSHGGSGGSTGDDSPNFDPIADPPCDSDDPPDYCDENGSCFDKYIGNPTYERLLEAAEASGQLREIWQNSQPDEPWAGDRVEQMGLVTELQTPSPGTAYNVMVPNQSSYVVQRPCQAGLPQSFLEDQHAQTPIDALIHTQPFSIGEQVQCGVFYIRYGGKISKQDVGALSFGNVNVQHGIMLDRDGIVFFDDQSSEYGDVRIDRCGY